MRWPRTFRGRIVFILVTGLLALGTMLGVIGLSIWIEDRFPSEERGRALFPTVQQVVTRPVVQAVSRQLERQIRKRAEARYMVSGLSLEETIARFQDQSVGLEQRRLYAYRLARVGTPECIAALLTVLQTAAPPDKAFMAQLIGSTGNPAAKQSLWPLLGDENVEARMAAIRGLSVIGGDDVTETLSALLRNERESARIRLEAAAGLGTVGTTEAQKILVQTLHERTSRDLTAEVLNSLGRFQFSAVAGTFEEYLNAPDTPASLRVVAAEALAESSSDAAPFLLTVMKTERNPEVRGAAAWAISSHQAVDNLGAALADATQQESNADVRRRLYEALLPQAEIPVDRLWSTVRAEEDVASRVAGFNALGTGVSRAPDSPWALTFDQEIVPELLHIATEPNSLNLQMRAVFALRRAQTPAAQDALQIIARQSRSQVATAARNGLRPPKG